ncbi:MAG: hypothetical protein JNN05_06195 [Candidatus Omnitrophica bacterium]|nr:hypothetical protein [Candidatus Omnitrophota bacterium]
MSNNRSLSIYQREMMLYIAPKTVTKSYNVNYESPPEMIDVSAVPEDVGKAVLKALSRCRLAVDDPSQKADIQAKKLGIPKVRNWNELQKCISCIVCEYENNLAIYSLVKKRGYSEFGEKFVVEVTNTADIGERVKQALALYQPLISKKMKEI